MKQYRLLIIFCIVMLGVISCNPQPDADKLLHQAKDIMDANPDSAMKLIDSIFYPEKSFSQKLYMEFLITQTEAKYKTYHQINADTLIYKARDYFTKENNNPEQIAIAWFYSGCVYREQEKYADAMHHYKYAEKYALQTDNFDLKGLIKFNIGDLLSKQGLYKEALDNYKIADSFYKQSSNKSYAKQAESLTAISEVFILGKESDSTFFYLNKGLEIAKKYNDAELQRVLTHNLGIAYLDAKQYDKAETLLKQSYKLNTDSSQIPYYFLDFAKLYVCIGDADTIIHYIQELKEYAHSSKDYHFRASAYAFLSDWEKNHANYENAFIYEEARTIALMNILKEKDNQKVYDAQLKYNYEHLQKMYYKNVSFWQLVIFALLITLIALIFIWRRQRKTTLIDKSKTEAKLILSQQKAEEKKRIVSVALPYLNLHSSIQNQLLDFSSKVRGKDKKLGDAFDEILKNNKLEFNDTTQQIFTDELMLDVVGISKGLELLTPSDRLLILMLAIEVDNNDIAALLNTTPTNFKSKKSYLKKKIQTNAEKLDNYDFLLSIF